MKIFIRISLALTMSILSGCSPKVEIESKIKSEPCNSTSAKIVFTSIPEEIELKTFSNVISNRCYFDANGTDGLFFYYNKESHKIQGVSRTIKINNKTYNVSYDEEGEVVQKICPEDAMNKIRKIEAETSDKSLQNKLIQEQIIAPSMRKKSPIKE